MAQVKLPVTGRAFSIRPARTVGSKRPGSASPPAPRRAEVFRPPSVGTQMRNAAAAGVRVLGGLLRGELGASKSVVAYRHSICRENSCGRYDAGSDRCRQCGCWLRAKAWLSVERCPLGLW